LTSGTEPNWPRPTNDSPMRAKRKGTGIGGDGLGPQGGKSRMRNREILSSLVGLGLGTLFLIGSLREGLFRKGVPGPGFLPFITALALMGLSLMVFFPALGKKKGEKEAVEKFFPEKDSFRKILLGLGALFLYGVSLEYLGYISTTILFLVFTFRLMEREKWKGPLFFAVSTAFLTYLLFVVLLEVQLPKGILGIG